MAARDASVGAGSGWRRQLPQNYGVVTLFAMFLLTHQLLLACRLFDRLKSELQQEQDMMLPGGK